jgi:hypothetical protein
MAAGIVYLDVDDEITSAASRVRSAPGRRVALVLPYGSRVATSRINFRLLSRDALINEKQLAVVAADSATRALAASAGLPVFGSVAEYEGSLVGTDEGVVDEADGREEAATAPPKKRRGTPTSTPPATAKARGAAVQASTPPLPAAPITPTAAPSVPSGPELRRHEADQPAVDDATRPYDTSGDRGSTDRPWARPAAETASPPGYARASRPGSQRRSRLPLVIVLAALALVVLVGGVGAYVVLPSATIVVTPRAEALNLPDITVTADPAATEPDAAARLVPASVVPIDVTANDTFAATGKRVEETPAKGTVRFANLDFLRTNTVPGGSVVSTNAGVRFKTVATITVPRADLVGLTVFPGRMTVSVTAIEPGLAGNVEPNTIVIVPKGEDPQALKVVNPDATTGGTHDEFPKVAQEDVDGAVDQLTQALNANFQTRLADPTIAAQGATIFATTAVLGAASPTVDPATLVGEEVATFDLGLSATGTVLTVDPAPVRVIADELLRASIKPGHELVADSIDVQVSEPVVTGQSVAFAATATGQQVAVLDPDELRSLVLGKTLDEARSILAAYGDVELSAWPDWVGSVPTIADRVNVRVDASLPVERSASPEPSS